MESYSKIRVGDRAPDFTLPDDSGKAVRLKELRGRRVVLYFYPKDGTPGCTTEACEFRDRLAKFRAQDVVVLGVSPDSVRKHVNFKKKHALTFPLLSDADHAVCEAYGVWREKLFWGRKYMGVMRTTYVIGPTGRVEQLWEHVKELGHAAEVETWLRETPASAPRGAPAPRRPAAGKK